MKISNQYIESVRLIEEEKCDSYPFNVTSVKNLKNLSFHPKITFFVGEYGSGKLTLLEAIAIHLGFNSEGGSCNRQKKHTQICISF